MSKKQQLAAATAWAVYGVGAGLAVSAALITGGVVSGLVASATSLVPVVLGLIIAASPETDERGRPVNVVNSDNRASTEVVTPVKVAWSEPERPVRIMVKPVTLTENDILEWGGHFHRNETEVKAGRKPSDSEIDMEAEAWGKIKKALPLSVKKRPSTASLAFTALCRLNKTITPTPGPTAEEVALLATALEILDERP